jgi:hypothetical protein
MQFQSYYKLPAPQTAQENCVAHNGSLVPIPGRDVMVQSWYQGGISIFDWTDAAPPDGDRLLRPRAGGLHAHRRRRFVVGVLVQRRDRDSSEISRGLDIFELAPSQFISQNEIDAAKTVRYDYLNTQGQPQDGVAGQLRAGARLRGPAGALARPAAARLATVRQALTAAESASGRSRNNALTALAAQNFRCSLLLCCSA